MLGSKLSRPGQLLKRHTAVYATLLRVNDKVMLTVGRPMNFAITYTREGLGV